MKTGGRALISTVLSALLLICASHAQDTVSLTGIDVVREGDAAVIQLHTSGSADFRLDRFTMGNWVTLWSSRLSHSDSSQETDLDLDFSETTDLVTRATSVSGRHHGELRFYLGDQVDPSSITIRREDDLTVIVIPAAGSALPAGNVNGSPGLPGGGSFFIPRDDNIDMETEMEKDAVEADQIQTPEDDEDRHPVAVLGVSSEFGSDGSEPDDDLDELQSMVEEIEITANADLDSAADQDDNVEELRAGTVADVENSVIEAETVPATQSSHRSGVKPGRYKSGGQHQLNEPQGIVVATAVTDDARESIMPGVDSASQQDAIADSARVNTQQTLQDMPKDDGKADVDTLVNQLSDGQGVNMQEAAPSGSSRISTPGIINDPYKPKASYTLGNNKPLVGKAALEGLNIELFEIVGTPLDQAFTLLIAQTNYNVIVDSSVGSENNVSLSFKDGTTTLRDALDLLTTTYGLDYVVNANTIVIASEEKLYGGLIDFETKVFVLSYADPKSVKDILINTGAIGEKQVEAYLGETEYPTQGSGSTVLSNDSGTDITAKPIDTNISTTPRNAVVVKGTPAEILYVADLIKQIDRKPKRVELEVKVCEANDTALKNLGLEFNDFGSGSSIGQIWTEQFDRIDYDMNPLNAVDVTRQRFQDFSIGSFDRNGLGFQATLNLQIQQGNVESLAQPTLNTVDGKQAIYFAGERIPYLSSVSVDQGVQTQEISFLPIGVTLNFKPRLDADDLITIDVNPMISSLTEFREIGGVEAPRTSNRQLATTVRVMDGQPFVMAGLITNTERETISKIPMLGDFPLIGKLFRNKKKEGQRTEIIIIVTPHIYD